MVSPASLGCTGKPPEHRPYRRNRSVAGRQRHQSPKTPDQPEEPNSKRFRPCGNNASTKTSPMPPTRQQMREPTSDRQHTPHLDAGTTTRSARTKNPHGVRAGRPRPADNPPQSSDRGARQMITPRGDGRPSVLELRAATNCRIWLSIRSRARLRRAGPAGRHPGPATTDPTDRTQRTSSPSSTVRAPPAMTDPGILVVAGGRTAPSESPPQPRPLSRRIYVDTPRDGRRRQCNH
jgi:hypothetical protein